MSSQNRSLAEKIEEVKRQLAALGEMRPGSLSTQYNVCGSPGCRCKASPPKKHGPYYQVSYTRKGKSGTRFVRKEDRSSIQQQLKNYARMRTLVDRWIELATKLSDWGLAQERLIAGRKN
jgi:hypothetical protein